MYSVTELKNSNNRSIQINCVRGDVVAGEDGAIKIIKKENLYSEEYLPYATDSNGWLIQIEDVYMVNKNSIFIISSDGVIAHYKKEIHNTNSIKNNESANDWNYKILLENEECYYEIKEATIIAYLLSLYINTEFSGVKEYTFDIAN